MNPPFVMEPVWRALREGRTEELQELPVQARETTSQLGAIFIAIALGAGERVPIDMPAVRRGVAALGGSEAALRVFQTTLATHEMIHNVHIKYDIATALRRAIASELSVPFFEQMDVENSVTMGLMPAIEAMCADCADCADAELAVLARTVFCNVTAIVRPSEIFRLGLERRGLHACLDMLRWHHPLVFDMNDRGVLNVSAPIYRGRPYELFHQYRDDPTGMPSGMRQRFGVLNARIDLLLIEFDESVSADEWERLKRPAKRPRVA